MLDHPHAGTLAQIPRPEADRGNAGAIGFDERSGHGCSRACDASPADLVRVAFSSAAASAVASAANLQVMDTKSVVQPGSNRRRFPRRRTPRAGKVGRATIFLWVTLRRFPFSQRFSGDRLKLRSDEAAE
jgi:hypothetical protein